MKIGVVLDLLWDFSLVVPGFHQYNDFCFLLKKLNLDHNKLTLFLKLKKINSFLGFIGRGGRAAVQPGGDRRHDWPDLAVGR